MPGVFQIWYNNALWMLWIRNFNYSPQTWWSSSYWQSSLLACRKLISPGTLQCAPRVETLKWWLILSSEIGWDSAKSECKELHINIVEFFEDGHWTTHRPAPPSSQKYSSKVQTFLNGSEIDFSTNRTLTSVLENTVAVWFQTHDKLCMDRAHWWIGILQRTCKVT